MNDIYLDFHIAVSPDESIREIIPAALSEYSFEGFVEDDLGIHCYIKKDEWHEDIESIIKEISEQYHLPFVQHISTTEIQHKNWNEEWERSIQPINVSERFVIAPSWNMGDDTKKTVIIIDPKMTFGTGYHETTRLMIRLMENYIDPNNSVLDVGTGTGILAIAAAKMGAKNIVGIDIDEWSLDNGIENTRRNNVEKEIAIRIGSLEVVPESNFDIILANIFRNTILDLMDAMLQKLSSKGKIIFSGLLGTDQMVIEEALHERNLKIISVLRENDWIAVAAERR
ncbi:MAG TPA: 50S ribosomal protein L11 methyltransferase [Bacteroidetes bacterium]|nr:50S ribosomal protein L11 methyltransferase [Bacteroidota bacterium]